MLAAVLHDFNDLHLEQVPVPVTREPDEVFVQIKAYGICATDYKAIKGIRKNLTFPFIAGHEPSGIVTEIGSAVKYFKVGDEVICQPSGYCGFCNHCRVGNTHYCEHAFTTGGDGPIGLLVLMLMVLRNIKDITLIGGRSSRLERARDFGAAKTINYHKNAGSLPRKYFSTIVDASGSTSALETAFDVIKQCGKILLLGDYKTAHADFAWNQVLHREIS